MGTDLTFTILWANSADDKLIFLSYFSPKSGFDISCKLSPFEIICMKCLWGKIREIFQCRLQKILPRVLRVNGNSGRKKFQSKKFDFLFLYKNILCSP